MSTVSSLSSNHSITLPHSTYSNAHPVVCINPLHESKVDVLPMPTSLIKSQSLDLFNNSQDLFHRLCHQRSRLIQLYDLEIERRQPTSQLITFLNKIDQLINEYDSHESIIGNQMKKFVRNR